MRHYNEGDSPETRRAGRSEPSRSAEARANAPPARPARRLAGASAPARGLIVIALGAGAVALFLAVHAQWSPMHRWNRAFGDASFLLLALAMGIGAAARLWRPLAGLLALRREFGIYATLLAIVHLAIVLVGWVEWDLWRLFGFEFHPGLGRYVMVRHGFGLANAIGLVALALAIPLAVTSNDAAMGRLGAKTWKALQMAAVPLWWLSVAHVGYFLFAHFLSFHRATPEPNPLQWPFAARAAAVLALRVAAFVATAARAGARRRGPGTAPPA